MSDSEVPPAKRARVDEDNQNSQDSQTYGLHVTPEEVDRLREFQVLDEVKSDDEDSNDEGSDKSDSSEELPEEEIEKMLEEDLPEGFKGAPKPKEKKYVKRQKIILEEKGINYFEVLPLDWLMVRHCSGMPLYMHRATRVCTLSKPYFLGKGNTRRHDIPISAIPCLAYRIALKEEQKQMEIDKKIAEQIKNGTWTDPNKPTEKNENGEASKVDDLNGVKAKCPFSHLREGENGIDSPRFEQNDSSQDSDMDGVLTDKSSIHQNLGESDKTSCNTGSIGDVSSFMNHTESSSVANHIEPRENKTSLENRTESTEHNTNNTKPIKESKDSSVNYPESTASSCLVNHAERSSLNHDHGTNVEASTSLVNHTEPSVTQGQSLQAGDVNTNVEASTSLSNHSEPSVEQGQSVHLEEEGSHLAGAGEGSQRGQAQSLQAGEDSGSHLEGAGAQPVVLPGGLVMPPPRVETVSTSWKSQQLSAEQLNEYCRRLFKFKEVHIMHFMRWADRRKYTKARKTLQYPALPAGTKLITIPANAAPDNAGGKTAKRDWVMNMNGCSYLSVFHEYVRRALHKQPVYEFKQLENATAPYQATVYIGGMQYGVGRGSSKRQAKSQAARASIHILIPEMRDELPTSPGDLKLSKDDPDFTFFDYVTIEDPRIQEFCGAAAEPSPHAILRTCLLRNFGAGDRHIHTEMKKLEFQKIELTMKVGKHSATVVCKNKKQAKQRASQHILQQLHPHITSWGSLLRLYGSRSVKSCKEKKLEEQQITLLQDKARHNEPNHAVLEKLRNEMGKLRERDEAVVPIGTLLLADGLPTHSGSNLNNVDL